ncbi:MAG: CobD/CbiB family protein [Aquabacterium sp.]
MSFFAVLCALLLEQIKALPRDNRVHDLLAGWVDWAGRNFDAGQERHTWIVWFVSMLVPVALVVGLYMALSWVHPLWGLALDVVVLYLTLGFRQFSHYFTDIRAALDAGDEDRARELLAQWLRIDTSTLPRAELLRHVIEHALLAAHRHVFGVFFWFVLLSALGLGPAGAVLYRLTASAGRHWARRNRVLGLSGNDGLEALAQRIFGLLDHVPARMTAFGFAVVGNFEEAVGGWRRHVGLWEASNDGVILASAAGAVGVQLGGGVAAPVATGGGAPDDEPQVPGGRTAGQTPVLAHLGSVVGLVWRSVVLWLLLLALLTLANLVG